MERKPVSTLALACRWSRDPNTGRLAARWQMEAPVDRADVLRHFIPTR